MPSLRWTEGWNAPLAIAAFRHPTQPWGRYWQISNTSKAFFWSGACCGGVIKQGNNAGQACSCAHAAPAGWELAYHNKDKEKTRQCKPTGPMHGEHQANKRIQHPKETALELVWFDNNVLSGFLESPVHVIASHDGARLGATSHDATRDIAQEIGIISPIFFHL